MQFARPLAGSFFPALQGGRLLAYLEILAVGSGVRIFGLATQFVVLIILGRLLSKESFGDLMTAFGFGRGEGGDRPQGEQDDPGRGIPLRQGQRLARAPGMLVRRMAVL